MKDRVAQVAFIGALVLALALLPTAIAANRGGGGGKAGSATGSFTLVLLNSTDGLPHYGQDVTFDVTSNAYHPMVRLTCYQNGDWVKNQSVGFYAGWPWSQVFPLSSYKWPGGAADCNATLYYQTNRGEQVLDTMSFATYA
ncbi:MAG: hypothetical protein ACRDNH_10030 [Gaiellaceae bacterium]